MPLLGDQHPAIGMRSCFGASVEVTLHSDKEDRALLRPSSVLDDQMLVDSTDEDWNRMHDVRVNGQVCGNIFFFNCLWCF